MTDLAASSQNPRRESPRTDAEPLAFTYTEFVAGTVRAWVVTTLLLVVGWAILTGGMSLFVGTVMILIASLPAAAVGAPGAYAIGRLLRRSPRVSRHLAAFVGYGALVGTLTTLVAMPVLLNIAALASENRIFLMVNVPLSAIGVAVGWFVTMRRALRIDAGVIPRVAPSTDHDAAVEDELDERYRVIDPRQRPRD